MRDPPTDAVTVQGVFSTDLASPIEIPCLELAWRGAVIICLGQGSKVLFS